MPIMLQGRLSDVNEKISRMSLRALISYEAVLWTWMRNIERRKLRGKTRAVPMHSDNIVYQLNAIHREVEWRAGQKEWDNAAHSQR